MKTLITILVIAVVLLIALIAGYFFIKATHKETDSNRKWTDPKFHD